MLFFVLLTVAMLPAAYLSGGADKMPGPGVATTSMREVLGQAMRNRQFLVMAGAYFVCGLNLMFLARTCRPISRSAARTRCSAPGRWR